MNPATTHTGEEFFGFGWPHLIVLSILIIIYLVLVYTDRLPSMSSFKDFADTVNSAGGHLIMLAIFSWYFFGVAMRFVYHILALPDETITKRDAIISTGIAFVTGSAFGGAWSALLKTMSGGKANGTSPAAPEVPSPVTPAPAPVDNAPHP